MSRLETRQEYAIAIAEWLATFCELKPRPERSVATNTCLRHVAPATLDGKQWTRAHAVDHPLSKCASGTSNTS